jgi:DNA-binding transcriptional MocR family regulator
MNRVLCDKGDELLNYGDREGYRPLREYIANRLQIHEVDVSADEILITNGSQNGIDLVLKLMAELGRKVYVEAPTYSAVLPLFKYYQLELIGIPMTDEGLDLAVLEQRLERDGNNGFLYTIPNFQNPTGITTCQNHRESLLKLCEKHKLPIIEDGFEEEMKYYGKVSLPIKSMDKNHIVIYLGTFSKVLFPGVRIGWIAAEKECISRITAIKRFSELSSSPVIQAALHEFCSQGYYDLHIKRMHRIFRKRMQTAITALKAYMPMEYVYWKEPVGGYLIWLQLKNTIAGSEEIKRMMEKHHVAASPGEFYFHDVREEKYFRISISTLDENKITEGIKRFAAAIRELNKKM